MGRPVIKRKRWYVVWHQDTPGMRVTVLRRIIPNTPHAKIGERFVYGHATTSPPALDMTYAAFINQPLPPPTGKPIA